MSFFSEDGYLHKHYFSTHILTQYSTTNWTHVLLSPAHWWKRKIPWNLLGSKTIMVYSYLREEPNW